MAKAALVVDDSAIAREFLIDIVKRLGLHPIRQAENGVEGLDVVRTFQPDVVFLDIEMPVMGGLEALKEIRKFDRRALIVMMTSIASPEVVRACIDGGTDYYVLKDLPEEKIEARLRQILSQPARLHGTGTSRPPSASR